MEIKLKVIANGDAPGTCGWLAKNAGFVRIGVTNRGRQGAWLLDKQGRDITVLAVRGYYGDNTVIDRAENDVEACGRLTTTISFTEPAWKVMDAIISAAVAEMEQMESRASIGLNVNFT